ncbi:MAG TPA: DUF899 family protein [Caulobacteraceae bacterium]|nr:DUF899 family protein [Caulobacteraceae bacterium]
MDAKTETLTPAARMAAENAVRIPNESAEYRAARTSLLAEEIELRRRLERVAAQRRALPPGGPVSGDYRFQTESGPTDFVGLFGGRQTLAIFSYMFGPQRQRPCPMCTNMLDAWDGNAADISQHASLVVVARSPIEKLIAWKQERGWKHLRLASDLNDAYSRDYLGVSDDGENGVLSVFTRRDGTIRHFWSNEMSQSTVDPGQDVRGVLETYSPLWHVLDTTPEGRAPDWYPSLNYA